MFIFNVKKYKRKNDIWLCCKKGILTLYLTKPLILIVLFNSESIDESCKQSIETH
jgi:hypothetical protein